MRKIFSNFVCFSESPNFMTSSKLWIHKMFRMCCYSATCVYVPKISWALRILVTSLFAVRIHSVLPAFTWRSSLGFVTRWSAKSLSVKTFPNFFKMVSFLLKNLIAFKKKLANLTRMKALDWLLGRINQIRDRRSVSSHADLLNLCPELRTT